MDTDVKKNVYGMVAEAMRVYSLYPIEPEMVRLVFEDDDEKIYIAKYGNAMVLCKFLKSGSFFIKDIHW